MPPIDPATLADLFENRQAAEDFFRDPSNLSNAIREHLPLVKETFDEIKGQITEPRLSKYVEALSAELDDAHEKLPTVFQQVLADIDTRRQAINAAKAHAEQVVKETKQEVAGHQAKIAAIPEVEEQDAPAPERIGRRLRDGLLARYRAQVPADGTNPPDNVSFADWAWTTPSGIVSRGEGTVAPESTSALPVSAASPETKPPATTPTEGKAWGSFYSLSGAGPVQKGEGKERGFSSWLGETGESLTRKSSERPPPEESQQRFLDWQRRLLDPDD